MKKEHDSCIMTQESLCLANPSFCDKTKQEEQCQMRPLASDKYIS